MRFLRDEHGETRTSYGLVVVSAEPHEPRHEGLWQARTQTEIQAWSVRTPEKVVCDILWCREDCWEQRQEQPAYSHAFAATAI